MKSKFYYWLAVLFIFSIIHPVLSQTIVWYTLGTGVSSPSDDVVAVGDDVYVGGDFSSAGGNQVNRIAKWDGNSWSALGSGTDGEVYAVAAIGSDIYAAGAFTLAGGVSVNHIAKWDGTSWSPLGQGLNDLPICLTASGNDLYAGGFFTQAGGVSANRIAKWDGSAWIPLGSGFNNEVDVVAVSGTYVYAGGVFTAAGGNTVLGLAKWDGNSWSEVGGGVSGYVLALAFDGNDIYVGGNFSKSGVGSWLLRWDGAAWHLLGSGVNGIVNTLMKSGNDLYAGGAFNYAGGQLVNKIAKFNINNSTWSPIGEGVLYGDVNAMSVQGATGSMVIAGSFYIVGNNIQGNHIARFTDSENPLPVELTSFNATAEGNNVNLDWSTATESNNKGFEVEREADSPQSEVLPKADMQPPVSNSDWEKIGFVDGHGTTMQENNYSFVDKKLESGNYSYKLVQIDFDGTRHESKTVNADIGILPDKYSLSQNYPNPFNPSTKLSYVIGHSSLVNLKVYDVLGREVTTLVNEIKQPGKYTTTFDASKLSSGIYYYRLQSDNQVLVRKMILIK